MVDPLVTNGLATADLPGSRIGGDAGVSGLGSGEASLGAIAGMLNPQNSHRSSGDQPLPSDSSSTLPSGSLRGVGSHLSLQGLDPTFDHEGAGRAPGVSSMASARQLSSDNLVAAALGGLDINTSREPPVAPLGGSGLRRPGSYSSLSHGSGLHADDCLELAFQPRAIVINNLVDTVSDEDLQKDLESYGDVHTLYTATKPQGQVMVTFYDSMAAANAFAALQGRNINGRELRVDFHFSQKDAQAGRVFLFNIEESVPDEQIVGQLSTYGSIMLIRPHPTVPHCREVQFHDVRAAQRAFNGIYHHDGGVPTIDEDGNDPQPALHAGMRSANQSQPSFAPLGGTSEAEHEWGRSQQSGWANPAQPTDLMRALAQGQQGGNQDVMALLQQAPPGTIDQLMRGNYLPQHGSSGSLGGALGSSSALRNLDSQHGSAANLATMGGSAANLAGLSSSASHPDLAGAYGGGDASEGLGSLPLLGSSQSLSHLAGSGQLNPGQLAALQSSGLLGGLGLSQSIARSRRGMSTPDLTALPHNLQGSSGNLQGLGGLNAMRNAGGQYAPAELSGWGGNLGGGNPNPSQLDTLLAAQGLGGMGAMQRSVSALQLQQLQQSQQHQLLLQLAGSNPQLYAQMSQMRMGALGGHSHPSLSRSKSHRSDDNLAGGRLSRRAADPVVEAERRAQQDRQFALDEAKVLSGEDSRTTLMIKNIPNKYTQKMLLQTIDEQFSRHYDFFYLPIDFKNKCNVGYAFINMVQPKYIVPLTKRFNQRKWERFNSEKVCHISYARIQGKNQLITHFQNSSLLHEDKRCRPILFKSDAEFAGEQEPFPTSTAGRTHRARPFPTGPDGA